MGWGPQAELLHHQLHGCCCCLQPQSEVADQLLGLPRWLEELPPCQLTVEESLVLQEQQHAMQQQRVPCAV